MEHISEYGTQATEEQQQEPEATQLGELTATAAPLLVPVLFTHSIHVPKQMVTREMLLDILYRTNWVPYEMPVSHVHLEGTFTQDDLLHILHTTNWSDCGTASTPAVPRKGQKGPKGKGKKRGRGISEPWHVRFEGPQGGGGGASGGAVV
jgi:uncharacterized membrane protein YgcG